MDKKWTNGKKTAVYVVVHEAIRLLRDEDKSTGANWQYSGLGETMARFYGLGTQETNYFKVDKEKLRAFLDTCVEKKIVEIKPLKGKPGKKGSCMVYIPGERPAGASNKKESDLALQSLAKFK